MAAPLAIESIQSKGGDSRPYDSDGGDCDVRNGSGSNRAPSSVELREICAAVGGAGKIIGSSCIGEVSVAEGRVGKTISWSHIGEMTEPSV